jgi:hypothetical protein
MSTYERPDAVGATVTSGHDGYTVSVVALAWGVHRLFRDLFADEDQATRADATAKALLAR